MNNRFCDINFIMGLGEKIKDLRKDRKWSQKELAIKFGSPQSTISAWETNRNGPNPKQRQKLCELFGISLDELYGIPSKKEPLLIQKVPVISWVHANKFEDIPPIIPSNEFIYSDIKGDKVFALRIQNDCMAPRFEEGDIIIINPGLSVDHDDFVVVADHESNTATFKQYKQFGNKKVLHPLNPKYKDIELDHNKRYTIVGKVIAMQRKC